RPDSVAGRARFRLGIPPASAAGGANLDGASLTWEMNQKKGRRIQGMAAAACPRAGTYSPAFCTEASVVMRNCTSSLTFGAYMPRPKSVRLIVATASKPAAGWLVIGLVPTLLIV